MGLKDKSWFQEFARKKGKKKHTTNEGNGIEILQTPVKKDVGSQVSRDFEVQTTLEVRSSDVQTDLPHSSSIQVQTDVPNLRCNEVQTDVQQSNSVGVQTKEQKSKCTEVQTELLQTKCIEVQTELLQTKCTEVQTELQQTKCIEVQTDVQMADIEHVHQQINRVSKQVDEENRKVTETLREVYMDNTDRYNCTPNDDKRQTIDDICKPMQELDVKLNHLFERNSDKTNHLRDKIMELNRQVETLQQYVDDMKIYMKEKKDELKEEKHKRILLTETIKTIEIENEYDMAKKLVELKTVIEQNTGLVLTVHDIMTQIEKDQIVRDRRINGAILGQSDRLVSTQKDIGELKKQLKRNRPLSSNIEEPRDTFKSAKQGNKNTEDVNETNKSQETYGGQISTDDFEEAFKKLYESLDEETDVKVYAMADEFPDELREFYRRQFDLVSDLP